MRQVSEWTGYRPVAAAGLPDDRLTAVLFEADDPQPLELAPHLGPDANLVCVHLEGAIDWEAAIEDRRYDRQALPGTLNLGRAGERARVVYRAARARFVHFHMPCSLISEAAEATGAGVGFELGDPANRADPVMHRLTLQALAAMGDGLVDRLLLDSIGRRLAARLVERWSTQQGRSAAPTLELRAGDWRIKRVLDLVEDRLLDDITLAEMAAAAGVSPSRLIPLFKAATGAAPYSWVLGRKIARAIDLMTSTRLTITEIAHMLGFASSQHFATAFRKRTGVAPSRYHEARAGRHRDSKI